MSAERPKKRWTPGAYLEMERASPGRHELHDGEIFAMSGASRQHNLLVSSLGGQLYALLRGRPCEYYLNDMRVALLAQERYLYPDAVVVCGGPVLADGHGDTLLNPSAIFEVLSDSTEAFDRGQKFGHYRAIASVREYVLLSQTAVAVEHFTRQDDGTWSLRALGPGDTLRLVAAQISLSIDELYERVFPAVAAG